MKNASDINFTDLYLNWLKENIEQYKIKDNIFRMTFPFLDRNNDFTEFYIIQRDNGTYCLTDDGATISELQYSGFEFNKSKHRKAILNSIIAAYGVTLTKDNELTITCTLDELPFKKHMLSQCMIKVGDLFYLSKTNVQSVFLEDVQKFFDENDIRYVENFSITGKSKLTTHFDFAIAKSKTSPERLVTVVNKLELVSAKTIIFAWSDTKELRKPGSKLYTFIQDTDKSVSVDALSALKEYGIQPALWSKRTEYIKELAA